jgi:formate hydrogenlyase subunit 6/NADH:ubiquinone oxidoreductase subunit I
VEEKEFEVGFRNSFEIDFQIGESYMGFRHIYFKEDVCTGCNVCVNVCMCDALAPNPVKGKPPIEMYPEECWFCGCCMTFCPQLEKGAIQIVTPFPMRGGFRRGRKA